MARARAAVQVGPRKYEVQDFEIPHVGADDAVMRIETCGLCGSDVDQYDGKLDAIGLKFPLIPGHEPIGIIEAIGSEATRRWGLKQGDRVAVEPTLGCGRCRACMTGNSRRCRVGRPGAKLAACGFIPISIKPALWGGLAEYMYLDPNAAVHKVSREIPAELAALFQPVAAGISWAYREPNTRMGDIVVIFGAGQRGLTSVIAAREAGAAAVFVVARRHSAHRLALARVFGADETIFADEDVVKRVRELTRGEGADVIVDVTAETMAPIPAAIEMAKAGGTIVLAGVKGPGVHLQQVEHDRIFAKELTIKGVKNADYHSFEIAIKLIESRKYPLEKMHTHSFGLGSLKQALLTLAGRVPGENAVSVSINPAL
jgi:threonine dehydrogenase-like Zn-dependent dehydrogenase